MGLTHVNTAGEAKMVDVGNKKVVHREAEASGAIFLQKETIELIKKNLLKKGDVLAVARIAAISGAKKTFDLIPLCHNIPINKIDVSFDVRDDRILIKSRAACDAKTGIEMEALTAVSIAALTIYDMCKAVDKTMKITDIKLEEKRKNGKIKFKIDSVNLSDKKGVQKRPVTSAEMMENHGIKGDAHAGNWHRQVSFLAGEAVDDMRNKAGAFEIKNGDFGENIITRGIDWTKTDVGGKIHIGDVELEVTQIGKECHTRCAIFDAVGDCIMPTQGIFAKVLKGGIIHAEDSGYYSIRQSV
jgi:cyclic pyranopterin phosphate synthase